MSYIFSLTEDIDTREIEKGQLIGKFCLNEGSYLYCCPNNEKPNFYDGY